MFLIEKPLLEGGNDLPRPQHDIGYLSSPDLSVCLASCYRTFFKMRSGMGLHFSAFQDWSDDDDDVVVAMVPTRNGLNSAFNLNIEVTSDVEVISYFITLNI